MLGELAVFHAGNVSGDPGGLTSITGEPAMRNHEVPVGEDDMVFVFRSVRQRTDEVE